MKELYGLFMKMEQEESSCPKKEESKEEDMQIIHQIG